MSLSSCETPAVPLTAPITGINAGNGSNNGMWGQEWIWIIVLFLFAGGWGRGNGFGNGGGAYGPDAQGYDTRADIQRGFDNQSVTNKLNGLENGLCSLGYDQLNQMNGITQTVMNGFNGVDNAVCQLGYNVQQGFNQASIANLQGQNALASQIADCCCTTQRAIDGVNYNAAMNANATQAAIHDNTTQGIMNANAIQNQIQQCCCENEKIAMQSRFDAQQYNCSTLQAIDRVGDRIIDYLAADKAQTLRDENQALRLAASQSAQNQYLINQLKPCPQPAYITCNPFTGQYGGFAYNQPNCACSGGC